MAYWVAFPFTVREAAEEFLREMEERGWAGAILKVDGNDEAATARPRLRLVSDSDNVHSIRVEEV